jgi:hypothetical protein
VFKMTNPVDKDETPRDEKAQPYKDQIARGEPVGLYLNVFIWSFIIRPAVSIAAAIFIVSQLWMLDIFVIQSNLIDFWIGLALVLLFALIFGASEGTEPEVVPAAHAAMITLFGKRFRVYRTEGEYSWTGKRLFLGRLKIEPGEAPENPAEQVGLNKDGFVNLGEIQIPIWNRADTKNVTEMELVARDSTTIKATLLIVIQLLDPYAWTTSSNPLLDIAERARSAFRTAASYFNAVDNAAIKSVLGTLMSGKTVVTSFIRNVVENHTVGSVILDEGGVHMYDVLPADVKEDEVKNAVTAFEQKLADKGDKKMLEEIKAKKGSGFVVEVRSVEDAIEEVIESVGAKLIRASVGTITLPKEVTDEANKAASEARQRDSQVASARAFAESKKIMDAAKTDGDEVAAAIAAAKDNSNVQVIFVPGSDPLTKAAVAAASQIRPKTGA